MKIVNRWDGSVVFEDNAGSIIKTVENAVAANANLSYAYLSGANLRYANLSGANLRYAYLSYANLRYANLSGANLRYAYLSYAYLSGAYLSGANLSYADLSYADLHGADLSYADLHGANLHGAKDFTRRNDYLRRLFTQGIDARGRVRLCKLVQTNGTDFKTGSIVYHGEVECPDWDENPFRACGGGLHFSRDEDEARRWQPDGRLIWAWVDPADIAVNPTDVTKVRVRKCEVIPDEATD
jgi:hypothetical protein